MSVVKKNAVTRKILLVDDDSDFRWAMSNVLQVAGHEVVQARDGDEALEVLEKDIPDCILLDYRMPRKNGLSVATEVKQGFPAIPIVMITAYAEVKYAVKAMKIGVYDYVTKPIDNNELLFTINRALEKQELVQEIEHLRKVLKERATLYELMGKSDAVKKLVYLVEKVAPTSFTVLIEGESGVGKELVARAIHDFRGGNERPFVAVDCGAIPESLIESELFGYMKGAFTGAHADKPGQFELADKGTLFLDEIGNLPYLAQQKLLRTMQERRIQRLGAKQSQSVQVRIIAATNQPLEKDVEEGGFRSDLYFRLKEFAIKVPALRKRKDDIPYLAKRFMDEVQLELDKKCDRISKEALACLISYQWPGNVRELRNVIRQAVLLSEENIPIKSEHLVFSSRLIPDAVKTDSVPFHEICNGEGTLKDILKTYTDAMEKKIIKEMLSETRGNKSEAARRLGIDYKTLLRKIKIYFRYNDPGVRSFTEAQAP